MKTAPTDDLLESSPAPTPTGIPSPSPFLVGLRAARANLVPGLGVQAFMLGIVYAYYWQPRFRPWFDRLGEYKQHGGAVFTVASSMVAGAVLPILFTLACLERRAPARRDLGPFFFACGFYGCNGLAVDLLYRAQNAWFGTASTAMILVKKVLVDQLVYNPIFAAPFAVACFAWKNQNYQLRLPVGGFTLQTYTRRVVPTLLATWAVWIPVVAVLYSLPPLLQIPVYSLALCFWAMMLTYIHAKTQSLS